MEQTQQDIRLRMEDYQLLHQLGSGSYGSVHLALHLPSNQKQVIKRIKISHLSQKEIEEARQEVEVLSRLLHPYISHFQGSCEEEGCLLIAMDYCAGGDLHSLITKRNGVMFPEDRVLDWFVQLCLAIKYIHDRKILHRDIKSQNVFLTDDGKVRLGDFGIAKILNSSSDLARTCIGTPYYLSPEMCENKPYNNKSDIWALGCVLYEMLTLKHAFEATNMKALIIRIIKGIYPPIPARYSRDLRMLLASIFQRDPQTRPSISAILRKSFIFKRVSRFISGCEEEDLKASLVRKKCPFPASARKIPVVKRPSDITEPSAKYGVSMNKRNVGSKSPAKSALRNFKPAKYDVKKSPRVITASASKVKKQTMKNRCPSESDLLANGATPEDPQRNKGSRYQRRSKSVPNAFKQGAKPQENVKEPFSPVKLQLILDSAGLRHEGAGACGGAVCLEYNLNSVSAVKSPEANSVCKGAGWLADEFLSRKLQSVSKKRELVEALAMVDSSGDGSHVVEGVFQAVDHDHDHRDTVTDKKNKKGNVVGSEVDGKESTQTDMEELLYWKGNGVEAGQNQKEEKDKANESLRQLISSSSSEEDSESEPMVTPDTVRQIMQDKMKKLIQKQTDKMNKMIEERRQWAYQKEKVDHVMSCNGSDEVFLQIQGNGELKDENEKETINLSTKVHMEVCSGADEPGMTKEIECAANLVVQKNDGNLERPDFDTPVDIEKDTTHKPAKDKVPQNNGIGATAGLKTDGDKKDVTETADIITSSSGNGEQLGRETCESNVGKEPNSIPDSAISKQNEECQCVSETAKGSDTSNNTFSSHSSSSPSKRGHWKSASTAGLENSPLETTASGMDSTSSIDCVVVYREPGDRKQWQKDNQDIVHLLSEAQIMRQEENHSMNEKNKGALNETVLIKSGNNKSSVVSEKCVMMNSTFTVKDCLKECPRDKCNCTQVKSTIGQIQNISGPLVAHSSVLNSTFNIMKEGDEKLVLGPPLLNSTFEAERLQQSTQEVKTSHKLNFTYKVKKSSLQETHMETPAVGSNIQPEQSNVTDAQQISGGDCAAGKGSLDATITIKNKNDNSKNPDVIQVKDTTFTLPSPASSATAQVGEQVTDIANNCSLNVELRNNKASVPSEAEYAKTDPGIIRRRSKGSIFEKFKLHMSPQVKQKHQHSIKGKSNTYNPQATDDVGVESNIRSSDKGTVSEMQTPVLKRKGKLKTGIVGIIKRLSSKTDMKTEEKYVCLSTERRVGSEPSSCVNSVSDYLGEMCHIDPEVKAGGKEVETGCQEHQKVGNVDHLNGSNQDNIADIKESNILPETLESHQCTSLNSKTNDNQGMAEPQECNESENISDNNAKGRSEEERYKGTERLGISGVILKIEDCSQTVQSHLDEVKQQIISNLALSGKEMQVKSAIHKGPPVHYDNVSIDSGLETQQTSIYQPSDNVSCSSPSLLNCTLSEQSIGSQSPAQLRKEDVGSESVAEDKTKAPAPPTLLYTEKDCSSPDQAKSSMHSLAQLMINNAFEAAEKTLSCKSCDKQSSISPVSTSNIFIDVHNHQTVDNKEVQLPLGNEKLTSNSQKSPDVDKNVDTSNIQVSQGESQVIKQNFETNCIAQKTTTTQPLPSQGSPGRPRPTVLNVGAASVQHKNTRKKGNMMTAPHLSISQPKESFQNSYIRPKEETCKSEKSLKNQMKQEYIKNKIVTSESDPEEDTEDGCSMGQSRELLLCTRDRVSLLDSYATSSTWSSEVWHLDRDGSVVPGGGGVYGWIEEQRAKLEDILGLSLFMKAYHHLEEAQEREGCVVGEAIGQVEQLLGPCHHHLAYDILQLVVSEAVYHN